ncbi:SGNH/GDSL hydrolase family protein [Cellulomonas sp. McL0617]|uniref:SGNH/GDSL hydrolase family protein n=1 Tax=Cellulomonas sp. McL0617 TaxID=3415675 RepID=UPI003CEE57B0
MGAVVVVAAVGVFLVTRPADGKTPSTAAVPAGASVAFYGDSYTFGEQASSPAARWSTVLAQQEGWVEHNAGINGLGFVADRDGTDAVQTVLDAHPDLIIVTMGLNDTFVAEDQIDEITTAIHDDFARFRAEAPQARLVVVEPFWIPAPVSPGFTLVADAVKAGAAEVHADYVAGAGDWLTDHPEWRSDDQYQHPDDAGYAEIARRMTIELKKLGVIAD